MKLIMLGAHQRTTPIALLEQFTFSREALPHALQKLRRLVAEGMIVSTCNRVEVYACVPDVAEGLQALEDFLVSWNRSWLDLPGEARQIYSEEAVVRHIFRLAAGLDSMVLGDDQIMGQIKGAYAASREAGITGKLLHRLVDRALAAGKLVRTQTRITSHPVSVVSVALDQAEQHLGGLAERRCLIVGAGRTAELALKLLLTRHTGGIGVVNRTYDHGALLAARYQAASWPFNQLEQALGEHDVIISATTAPSFLISRDLLERSVPPHGRLFLDLSVPRSIDPDGMSASGDHLIDIEVLQEISRDNHAARASEIAHSEALIDPEVQAFKEWSAGQSMVPVIRDLRAHAEEIRAAEVRRALAHLPDLTSEEQQAIGALSMAIVNKLLHFPIMALKDPSSGAQVAEALNQMYHLSREKSRHYER